MKFKSQICTTKEQSKKLLVLGLKKETADMCWESTTLNGKLITYPAQDVWHCSTAITDYHIPAWSLHRLLEIMRGESEGLLIRENEEIYNHVVAYIANMIKGNAINPQFLEDKNK